MAIPLWQILVLSTIISSALSQIENKSRYDNYRVYKLNIENIDQVRMLQALEENSDSLLMGHARNAGQQLTIILPAHLIGEFTNLLERYSLKHEILVSILVFTYCEK